MVEVFDWQVGETSFGLGTKVEFEYWASQGVLPEGATLGGVLTREPASEDQRRKRAWGIE